MTKSDRMRKMKILQIITKSEMGGAQKHLLSLVDSFRSIYDIDVVCGGNGKLIEELEKRGIRVIKNKHLTNSYNPLSNLCLISTLYSTIKKGNYDIIHCHSTKAGLFGRIAGKMNRKKTIFTAHGFAFNEDIGMLKGFLITSAERIGGAFSDHIIAVSEKDRKSAIERKIIGKDKICTVHNGINSAEYSSFKSRKKGVVVGVVANLYRNKGVYYFIQAASRVIKSHPHIKFMVVGDGPLMENLRKMTLRMGVVENIEFTGFMNVKDALNKIDIVVIPSLKEGHPYIVLEAMASKKPIIATKVGGLPEVLEHGKSGILVRPKDADAISSSIILLVNDQKFALELGNKGRKQVEKNFTIKHMMKKTGKVYEKVIKNNTIFL